MGSPEFGSLLTSWWADGSQGSCASAIIEQASNIVIGGNPPWGAADFFSMYPKFGGAATTIAGSITGAVVTGIASTAGLAIGQPVAGLGIPPATIVVAVNSSTEITLSNAGANTGSISLTLWSPANYMLPSPALYAYIAFASASIQQQRWLDAWTIGMALFVAHYATLYLRSDGNYSSVPGIAAAAGLARGITTSKGVGGVSQGIETVKGLDSWAAWNTTEYGVQLATMGKLVGMMGMWIY